jgi:hypothetical protein
MLETLLVIDDDVMDRMGGMIRHLCVGLIDEAALVTVLSRSGRDESNVQVAPAQLAHVRHSRWPWQHAQPDKVLQAIGGRKPALIHCMSTQLAAWAGPLCGAWGSAMVVQLSDLHDAVRFARLRPECPVTGVAMTAGIQRALTENIPRWQPHIRLIPAGLPAEAEVSALSVPNRIPSAVTTMSLSKRSNLLVVLKALRTLIQAGHDVQLFLLSSGWAESRYRRHVQQLGLHRHVTFAGRLRDWTALRRAMVAADFYIATGVTERFDISGLSALASGLVILAPHHALEDYLIDEETAVRFDPASPHQLAQKWMELLQDPERARTLAQNALNYARTHHQANTMVTQLAALYREMSESRFKVAVE